MIAYHLTGASPSVCSPKVLHRIAEAFQSIRGFQTKRVSGIGVRFVSLKEMQRLNRAFRQLDRPTDVLSFSATEGTAFPGEKNVEHELGDVVICTPYAAKEARRRSIDLSEELIRLIAHGTLHLAGMDHATPSDEEKMFALQEKVVESVTTPATRNARSKRRTP